MNRCVSAGVLAVGLVAAGLLLAEPPTPGGQPKKPPGHQPTPKPPPTPPSGMPTPFPSPPGFPLPPFPSPPAIPQPPEPARPALPDLRVPSVGPSAPTGRVDVLTPMAAPPLPPQPDTVTLQTISRLALERPPQIGLSSTARGKPVVIELSRAPAGLESVVFYEDEPPGRRWIGQARQPTGISPTFAEGELAEAVWTMTWMLPERASIRIAAHGVVRGHEILLATKTLALTPPVEIVVPGFGELVKAGPTRVEADVPADCQISFAIQRAFRGSTSYKQTGPGRLFRPAFPGKELPPLDQHEVGDDLTGDAGLDDDPASKGDNSCAPTAVASSLKWFNDNGYAGLVPEGMSDKELVNVLGQGAGTGKCPGQDKCPYKGRCDPPMHHGTSPENMQEGVNGYLKGRPGGDRFETRLYKPPGDFIKTLTVELARKQDIILFYNHENYAQKKINRGDPFPQSGHVVAVDGVGDAESDGSRRVRIMNPRNARYEEITLREDGTIEGGDTRAVVKAILTICPKDGPPAPPPTVEPPRPPKAPTPESGEGWRSPLLLKDKRYAGGRISGLVDLGGIMPGHYLLRVTVVCPEGTRADYQSIYVGSGSQ